MASRKEQKEQARLARLAAEQQRHESAARMRRLQYLGGALVVAIAAIAAGIIISSGSSGASGPPPNTTPTTQDKQLYSQVNSLIGGIPESGETLGNPNARVTVTYYGDLECPVCQEFTLQTLPEFITNYVKTGKAKVVYRSLCTASCHVSGGQSTFDTQQVAAYSAGLQNLFWYYAELFYHQQGAEGSGYVTPSFLQGIADEIPALDKTKWTTDRQDPSLLAQVDEDKKLYDAKLLSANGGLDATPTTLFSGPTGEVEAGDSFIPYSVMVEAFKAVT